jgi:hypothetical protein
MTIITDIISSDPTVSDSVRKKREWMVTAVMIQAIVQITIMMKRSQKRMMVSVERESAVVACPNFRVRKRNDNSPLRRGIMLIKSVCTDDIAAAIRGENLIPRHRLNLMPFIQCDTMPVTVPASKNSNLTFRRTSRRFSPFTSLRM